MIRKTVATLALASCALVACDASKEELDKARATLLETTQERDALKTQIDAMRQMLAASQQQISDLTARARAATAAAIEEPEPAAAARAEHAGKTAIRKAVSTTRKR